MMPCVFVLEVKVKKDRSQKINEEQEKGASKKNVRKSRDSPVCRKSRTKFRTVGEPSENREQGPNVERTPLNLWRNYSNQGTPVLHSRGEKAIDKGLASSIKI